MQKDSLQYNDHSLLKLNSSAFKDFVGFQDDVPSTFYLTQNSYGMVNWDSQKKIQQRKLDDNQQCVSAFLVRPAEKITNQSLNRNSLRSDWIFFSFLFCLGVAAWFYFRNSKRLSQLFKAFLTPRSTNQLLREGNILSEIIVYPLLLIFFISASLLVSIIINQNINVPFSLYLQGAILSVMILFFLGKVILVSIIGAIFNTKKETREYLTNYFVFNIILGLVLVPLIFIIFYIDKMYAKPLTIILLIVFSLVYVFRLFRGFLIGISCERYNLYYLFLYLCTVEILPYGVSFKLIYNYLMTGSLIR
jgi:uncharacterized membrane protein YdcZ (DUF606 family)